jgi:hypothetical protein
VQYRRDGLTYLHWVSGELLHVEPQECARAASLNSYRPDDPRLRSRVIREAPGIGDRRGSPEVERDPDSDAKAHSSA